MKNIIKLTFIPAALSLGMTAHAGFFDQLKDNVVNSAKQAAVDTANQKVNEATNGVIGGVLGGNTSAGSVGGNVDLSGGPAANLIALTKCHGANISNVMVGNYGEYTFQSGMSKEKRSGLINRRTGTVSNGCILPSLQAKEVLYFEVDESVKRQFTHATMQCVKSANPSAGALSEPKDNYAYTTNYLTKKDIHLHCGNDQNVTVCGTGRNMDRGAQYKKILKARGKAMLSIQATSSLRAPRGGEKLYCQYFNPKTGTSLFAFEYFRAHKP